MWQLAGSRWKMCLQPSICSKCLWRGCAEGSARRIFPDGENLLWEALRITIVDEYDVIVCGGGPGGIGAGVSAACLESARCSWSGGAWTANLAATIFDREGKGGITAELCNKLCTRGLIGRLFWEGGYPLHRRRRCCSISRRAFPDWRSSAPLNPGHDHPW